MALTDNSRYLSVADRFSRTPGARYESDGDSSAQAFLDLMVPLFEAAVAANERLVVDLDGATGYASSFLQGTFGNLAYRFGSGIVRAHLTVISNDDPYLLKYVARYVEEADEVVESEAA